jgi:hypothetical protein
MPLPDDNDNAPQPWRPSEARSLDHLVMAAPFPFYGVVGHPDGLSLQSVGSGSWSDQDGHVEHLLQVSLVYAYPPATQRHAYQLELITMDPHPPESLSLGPDGSQVAAGHAIDDGDRRQYASYPSLADIPTDASLAGACVIERFPLSLAEQVVTTELRCWRRLVLKSAMRRLVPEWAFKLSASGLRVEGRAIGWTQAELFALLGQVTAVSRRPEVLAQYQLELDAWRRHLGVSDGEPA